MTKQGVTGKLPKDIGSRIKVIEEARLLFGEAYARELWVILSLPMPRQQCPRRPEARASQAAAFLTEMTLQDPMAQAQGRDVFEAYVAWATAHGYPAMTQTAFGRSISSLVAKERRWTGVVYVGVSLREVSGSIPETP